MTFPLTRSVAALCVVATCALLPVSLPKLVQAQAATMSVTTKPLTAGAHRTCTLTSSADTFASSAAASTNYGTSTTMAVRSDAADDRRAFVRFSISSCNIPAGAAVRTARLKLLMSTAPATDRTYDVHAVTAEWTEAGLDWTAQPTVNGTASASSVSGTTSATSLSWSVLADVRAVVAGTGTDLGWRVADRSESSATAAEAVFATREHATAGERPTLALTYYTEDA